MTCEHLNFHTEVRVNRLVTVEGDPHSPVEGYSADIQINCVDCGEPFVWMGPPVGLLPTEPCISVDGTELRAPIRPASVFMDGRGLAGFRVQAR